jgi:hypothetical protein
MRIRLIVGDQHAIATLYDNATARDFAALLPLSLTMEDYATIERAACCRWGRRMMALPCWRSQVRTRSVSSASKTEPQPVYQSRRIEHESDL